MALLLVFFVSVTSCECYIFATDIVILLLLM